MAEAHTLAGVAIGGAAMPIVLSLGARNEVILPAMIGTGLAGYIGSRYYTGDLSNFFSGVTYGTVGLFATALSAHLLLDPDEIVDPGRLVKF